MRKPPEFFDAIVRQMVKAGFVLISKVEISTDDLPHHTRTLFARASSLFFHVPGKSLVLHLLYDEDDYVFKGQITGRWNIVLYLQFKSCDKLVEMVPREQRRYSGMDLYEIPFLMKVPEITAFHLGQSRQVSRYNEEGFQNRYTFHQKLDRPIETADLVAELAGIRKTVLPYLAREFDRFRGSELVPANLFPGCAKLFWERFHQGHPKGYLYSIARKFL